MIISIAESVTHMKNYVHCTHKKADKINKSYSYISKILIDKSVKGRT